MAHTVIVVPCYNEARRLQPFPFLKFASQRTDVDFLFVNDGSTDDTAARLAEICELLPDRATSFNLPANVGKAEAVRQGVLDAFARECEFIGYWDADLATPLDVIPALVDLLRQRSSLELAMGSRVSLLGRQIDRKLWRHWLGRSFATAASAALGLPVYDTQCGAKIFRASPAMVDVFTTPFRSRWIFDVEILARLIDLSAAGQVTAPEQAIAEHPLQTWTDVAGSKLRARHFVQAGAELATLYWTHRGNQRRLRADGPSAGRSAKRYRPAATDAIPEAA